MLDLQKAIAACLLPLGTSILLGFLAIVMMLLARKRTAVFASALSIGWLLTWSLPPVSESLRQVIEEQVPANSVADLPSADVIVVLGGGINGAVMPWRPYPDLTGAADRVWHAARLYHAGKAPRILLSGGQRNPTTEGDEATAMAGLLRDFGVPADALILEKASRTTTENAVETARILNQLGVHRILLVTSALHMPRALLSFSNRGLQVAPASTDIETVPHSFGLVEWIPRADVLDGSSRAFHELLGIARCRLLSC